MAEPTEGVILPEKGKNNILVTSALPYVNNVPHLGNVIGSTLCADVFARYSKLRERPTLFICGTDEYGTATETRAAEAGVTPQQLCDEFHAKHKAVYDWFDIKFDYFGRTSTKAQTEIVQRIFLQLNENGFLEERTTTQPYCEKHEGFLADRYVEGTCPKCQYTDAQGDQCDKCQSLLDPFELIDPRCKMDGTAPVPRDTTHMFLRLDKLQDDIAAWFSKSSQEGNWSPNGVAITKAWLDKGLEGRSITRDMKWGVPVPLPGYEDKVIYVWFDACIGYPSITANYSPEHWEKWWKNPDEVKLYQFLGKDNTTFHSVLFPGSLLGAEPGAWTMLHTLSTSEFLNYENTKFSKSKGVGVFGDSAKETNVPAAVWRYYLLANRPESGDTQFEWSGFVAANNNELLANLGNFVNRVIKFAIAKCEGKVPQFSASYTDDSFDFPSWIAEVNVALAEYNLEMEATHLRAGLRKVMEISAKGNLLLQYRLDNANLASHPERTHAVVGLALNLCLLLASLASPFMPATSESMVRQLGAAGPPRPIPDTWDAAALQPGQVLGQAEHLFSRIDEKKIAEWRDLYGGTQASRAAEAEEKRKKLEAKEKDKAKKAARKAAKKAAGAEGGSGGGDAAGKATATTAATEDAKKLPIREKGELVEK